MRDEVYWIWRRMIIMKSRWMMDLVESYGP
jgi:hypothetical protein